MSPRLPEVPAIDPNMLKWCKRCLPITGVNFRPMPSMYSALHGSHCLGDEFIELTKFALKKKTS